MTDSIDDIEAAASQTHSLWRSSLPLQKKIGHFARRFRHLPNHFWTSLAAAVLILDLLSWTALSDADQEQRVWVLLGALVIAAGYAVASASTTSTRQEAVDIARIQYRDARTFFDNGQYDEALTLLDSNVDLDPEEPGNHTLRGRILVRKGRWEEAVPDFEAGCRLSALTSNRNMCRINLAVAHFMLGEMGDCLRTVDHILRDQPENSLALRWKALAWTAMDNTDGALGFALEAASLKPQVIANLATVGVVQAREGDVRAARKTLAEVLACRPDSAEDFYYLGLLRAALGDTQEAGQALDIAATRDERFASRRRSDVLATT